MPPERPSFPIDSLPIGARLVGVGPDQELKVLRMVEPGGGALSVLVAGHESPQQDLCPQEAAQIALVLTIRAIGAARVGIGPGRIVRAQGKIGIEHLAEAVLDPREPAVPLALADPGHRIVPGQCTLGLGIGDGEERIE